MTTSQDALNAVHLTEGSLPDIVRTPILKAIDRLRQLEHEQDTLLNREVIARELFIGPVHGVEREDRAKVWDVYLRIEAQGTFEGDGLDPREVLAQRRAQADSLVSVLHSAVAYA